MFSIIIFLIRSAQLWLINSTIIIQFFVHRSFLVLFCCKKGNLCLFYFTDFSGPFAFALALAKSIQSGPETHFQRQAALHDCLPRLLGDGYT
jgi:hypothetical protein